MFQIVSLALLLAQAGDAPEPGTTVECDVAAETRQSGRTNRITELTFTCPADAYSASQLQALADDHAGRVRLGRFTGLIRIASTVEFEWAGDSWRLDQPQVIIRDAPSFPIEPARRGNFSAICLGTAMVAADGRADRSEWSCFLSEGADASLGRYFIRNSRASAEETRWLTAAEETCVDVEFEYRWDGSGGLQTAFQEAEQAGWPQCPSAPITED